LHRYVIDFALPGAPPVSCANLVEESVRTDSEATQSIILAIGGNQKFAGVSDVDREKYAQEIVMALLFSMILS
jgi:hypothetical protein